MEHLKKLIEIKKQYIEDEKNILKNIEEANNALSNVRKGLESIQKDIQKATINLLPEIFKTCPQSKIDVIEFKGDYVKVRCGMNKYIYDGEWKKFNVN